MPAFNWNKEQYAAINANGGSVLVSAAAGSGKTAVLSERAVLKLTHPDESKRTGADRLAVVTFSNAAAAEMRERISRRLYEKLLENPDSTWIMRQRLLLQNADICTIHSFCGKLIRENFYRLSLSPDFRISEENELSSVRVSIIEELTERYLSDSENNGGFLLLFENVCRSGNDKDFTSLILQMERYVTADPFPSRLLSRIKEMYKHPKPLAEWELSRLLLSEAAGKAEAALCMYKEARECCTEYGIADSRLLKDIAAFMETAEGILLAAKRGDFDALRELLSGGGYKKKTSTKDAMGYRRILGLVNQAYSLLSSISGAICSTESEYLEDMKAQYPMIEALCEVTEQYLASLESLKRERGIMEFNDLEQYSVRLLAEEKDGRYCQTEIAREISSRYDEIMIDEYQDTNPVQDLIFRAIAKDSGNYGNEIGEGDNFFLVGDVKQSIYKFRRAMPLLFSQKLDRYPDYPYPSEEDTTLTSHLSGEGGDTPPTSYLSEENGGTPPASYPSEENSGTSPTSLLSEGDNGTPPTSHLSEENPSRTPTDTSAAPQIPEIPYPTRIILSKNYRSREEITSFANFVFSQIMSRECGEIDYDSSHELKFGATYYPEKQAAGGEQEQSSSAQSVKEQPSTAQSAGEQSSSAQSAQEQDTQSNRTEFCLLCPEKRRGGEEGAEDSDEAEQSEARYIAERISQMIGGGFLVTDKESKKLRVCTPDDFCVLLFSVKGDAGANIVSALADVGIPARRSDNDERFFDKVQISTIISYLRVIDNPLRDIPLLAVLSSPMFGFSPDKLAQIRLRSKTASLYSALLMQAGDGDAQCREFLETTARLRQSAVTSTVGRLISEMLTVTSYDSIIRAGAGGEERLGSVRLLIEYAAGFEKSGFKGLSKFMRRIDIMSERGDDLAVPSPSLGGKGAVTVMTIHKSKGLEFPVCILSGLGVNHSSKPEGRLSLHPRYLLGMDMKTADGAYRYRPFAASAIRAVNQREAVSEHIRVLYVAMTRAKEKMIMTASVPNIDKFICDSASLICRSEEGVYSVNPYAVSGTVRYAAWIMACILRSRSSYDLRQICQLPERCVLSANEDGGTPASHLPKEEFGGTPASHLPKEEFGAVRVNIVSGGDWDKYAAAATPPAAKGGEDTTSLSTTTSVDGGEVQKLREKFAYRYPYRELREIPAKVVATSLNKKIGGENPLEGLSRRPSFMQKDGMNAAERGTALHKFMELCDCSLAAESAEREVTRLVSLGFLSEEEAAVVDLEKIYSFFAGEAGRLIKSADEVYRERRFTVLLPEEYYSYLKPEAEGQSEQADGQTSGGNSILRGEDIVLQGECDLVLVKDGKLTIIDYKTDRERNPDAYAANYGGQLRLYSFAMSEVTGCEAERLCIYSFTLGRLIEVSF
ncbi:MAG: UvrD-helicase domain-containing protein [Oscillospiraceae bacterium]|jgi:ATP-dependent exoDNAse (exonuclease V) beta subunit|nr:UvrD-helicase domain-containing protein [Oscillospiraceae bacterium]